MKKRQFEKGNPKLINAWASYDWANSVYPLVISSTIFPIYYSSLTPSNGIIEFMGYGFKNTALISFVTAIAFVIVAFNSPLLSGIADYIGNKKKFMKIFVYTGSISCMGLYFFELESIHMGLIFYFFALIGFWASLVFYNSYLPDIAHTEQQDFASARGFSMGYIGSILLLLFNLSMVLNPDWYGITGSSEESSIKAMKYSFITVGIWWILFSQYAFYHLPVGNGSGKVTKDIVWNGFLELKKVWHQLAHYPLLKKFLPAFFVYSTALQTVILIATYFGEQEISWENNDQKTVGLIVSILLIQIVAIFGAYATAYASKKHGNILTLIVVNLIWAGLCVFAFFIKTPIEFYIAAAGVGMVMGGIQSLSRSTYSKLIPETDDTTSFFSFYDVTEKVGIIIGMVMFGTIDQFTGSMRNAILMFLILFIVGAFLLSRIPNNRPHSTIK
ncbi:MAG: MFS transporter [Flavobacteriaceae bacterium]|jgi:UMF1 family MFS transporter|nr:MFS transporter [Flavobacteriaceae bacterium]MDG1968132.1 MFS transporter [Flavobacteriaceae bacterium]